ncbi:MAG: OmpA family protein, partial [Candidatus Rokuibacteriota bacterium]
CALGDIAGAAQASVTVVVRATAPGTLTNSATVTSDVPDPVAANGASGVLSALVAAGPLRLSARELLVFRSLRSGVTCRLAGGPLRSCAVGVRTLGGRLLANGTARVGGGGRDSLRVRLRLTRFGHSLLDRRLGGVPVNVRALGISTGGERRRDAERVRAIIDPERFRTPPGAWVPDKAILTQAGERFLRSLRGRLIAVRRVVCEGHTALVTSAQSRFAIALSTARARLVCARLRGLGVTAPARIVFKGGTQPIASNATEAGRRANRRVEVVLRH